MTQRDYGLAEAWRESMDIMHRMGLLLVSANAEGKPNGMTIGWATLGIIWGKPILTVYVRPSRFTYLLMEATADFTVNVPAPGMEEVVQYCGTALGEARKKRRSALSDQPPLVRKRQATIEAATVSRKIP